MQPAGPELSLDSPALTRLPVQFLPLYRGIALFQPCSVYLSFRLSH
jgi:hypothetical protein